MHIDFRSRNRDSVSLVRVVLQASRHIHPIPLLDEFLREKGELAPERQLVPVGALPLGFSAGSHIVIRRDGKKGHLRATVGLAQCGIQSHMIDQDDLVA